MKKLHKLLILLVLSFFNSSIYPNDLPFGRWVKVKDIKFSQNFDSQSKIDFINCLNKHTYLILDKENIVRDIKAFECELNNGKTSKFNEPYASSAKWEIISSKDGTSIFRLKNCLFFCRLIISNLSNDEILMKYRNNFEVFKRE